jgi:lysozyme family protein
VTRDQIIEMIVRLEAGYSDNPADPGGATNFGITQRYLDNARNRWPDLPASVADLNVSQAFMLYQSDEWVEIHGDQLPAMVAPLVMDEAVNGGPGTAVRLLQESLNIAADGVIGPQTLAAAQAADPAKLAAEYAARRAVFYAKLEDSEAQFELGWMRRLITVYALSIAT